MCTSPVKIRNKKILFRNGIDKEFLEVPCGHCWQCIERKCNDYFVRLYSVLRDVQKKGGVSFFLTMTMSDEFMPSLGQLINPVWRPDMPLYKADALCFNKKRFSQFVKDLRKFVGDGMQVFCVCEFGLDESHTMRPHYHVLFFIPRYVSESQFLTWCEFCWSQKLLKRDVPQSLIDDFNRPEVQKYLDNNNYFWKKPKTPYFVSQQGAVKRYFKQLGWCMYSPDYGAKIDSPACLRYVLKYLHKDSLTLSNSWGYFVSLKKYYKENTSIDVPEDRKVREAIRSALPFVYTSRFVGQSIVDYLQEFDAKTIFNLYGTGINVYGKNYRIPIYVMRKLFYQKDEILNRSDPIFSLNEKGQQFFKLLYDTQIKGMQSQMDKVFSDSVLSEINFDSFKCDSLSRIFSGNVSSCVHYLIQRFRYVSKLAPSCLPVYYYVYQNVQTLALCTDYFDASRQNLVYLTQLGRNIFDFKIENYFVTLDKGYDGMLLDFHDTIKRSGHFMDYAGFTNHVFMCNEFGAFEFFDDILKLFNFIYKQLFDEILADAFKDLLDKKSVKSEYYSLLKLFGYVQKEKNSPFPS